MGYQMHTTFERREEWNAARLGEVEFVETARALKALAQEHNLDPDPVMECLADKGLDQTLALLTSQAGANVAAAYYRCRATVEQK